MTTRILRLLLLAAMAWPTWLSATAQEPVNEVYKGGMKSKLERSAKSSLNLDNENLETSREFIPQAVQETASKQNVDRPRMPMRGVKNYAPSLKAGSKQIYDYYEKYIGNTNYSYENVPLRVAALNTSRSEGQMIYSSSLLGLESGVEIVSISFYATAKLPAMTEGQSCVVNLRVGETNTNVYSGSSPYTELTNLRNTLTSVYQGTLPTGSQWVTFDFNEPYIYNGTNLVVDLSRVSGDYSASDISWYSYRAYGTYYSVYSYNNGSRNNTEVTRYLPYIQVTYRKPHSGTVESRTVAVKDSTFFKGKSYKWPYNADASVQKTSTLNDVATDPDQMIAMVRAIYMDPEIPGNLKRGFATDGSDNGQNNQDVYYSGVCGMALKNGATAYNNVNSYTANSDDYGWGIFGTVSETGSARIVYNDGWSYSSGTVYYANMDPNQYKPKDDGLTLLLVELKEDYVDGSNSAIYSDDSYTSEYERLRAYFQNTVKSIQVVKEAKRMGDGLEAGTLFKIDCDKMNKFFLLAKGQLNLDHNSAQWWGDVTWVNQNYTNVDFCIAPHFMYCDLLQYPDQFIDVNGLPLFYHMFEQFSPVASNATAGKDDIYQSLINMESFGVKHDCIGITNMNHQFLMYGAESKDADCQDVRDMMFFVPDYRMLEFDGRGTSTQEYHNYHPDLQPTMGLYVIRQNEITPTTAADDYYMLNLNWVTNLDQFLPSEEQEFELLQVVLDEETGEEKYVPVYYMNGNGEYTDANGNVVETPVPIVLHMGPGAEKNYKYVYVKRLSSSQEVTYAIRGRDVGKFLSLQISNRQSYIIPGTDPTELVSLIELSHYSRYNPQAETNCYSNRFKLSNNAGGVRRADITSAQANQTAFTFTRKTSSSDQNPVVIATARVTDKNSGNSGKITVKMENQSPITDFPKAKTGNGYAGYHANPVNENGEWEHTFTYKTVNGVQYVDFGDLILCDNFVSDVSNNAHPGQYIYEVNFNIAKSNEGAHDFDEAHGSAFNVHIYKTNSKINKVYTQEEVRGDMNHALAADEDLTFEERMQYSSKTEILRYDVYRWADDDEDRLTIVEKVGENDFEQDIAPHGIAGNQGEGYTVSMNDVNGEYYYNGGTVAVSSGYVWANFVDYYPQRFADKKNKGTAYTYAPVVETFTVGKNVAGAKRTDYNSYGGPQKTAAVGVLKYKVSSPDPSPESNDGYMSVYNWTKNGKTYAYYNVPLTIETKEIPEGFGIYKIRAWREIDEQYLDEEHEALADRMNCTKPFEEFTYDPTVEHPEMAMDIDEIGVRPLTLEGATNLPKTYTTGTFGAQKVGDGTGEIQELPMKFKVRIYFTRKANLPVAQTSNAAHLLDATTTADGKYYIVEKDIDFTLSSENIVTAIQNLNSREVAGVKYYNVAGVESDRPFQGVNIVVTRYTDGTMTTTKVVR